MVGRRAHLAPALGRLQGTLREGRAEEPREHEHQHRHVVGPAQHLDRHDVFLRQPRRIASPGTSPSTPSRSSTTATITRCATRSSRRTNPTGTASSRSAWRDAGKARVLPEAHDPPHAEGLGPQLDQGPHQRLPHPRAGARAGELYQEMVGRDAARHRLRRAGGDLRHGGRHSWAMPRRWSTPRTFWPIRARPSPASATACGIAFDDGDAVMAGGPQALRRRLGAALVQRGLGLDRLRRTAARTAAASRSSARTSPTRRGPITSG